MPRQQLYVLRAEGSECSFVSLAAVYFPAGPMTLPDAAPDFVALGLCMLGSMASLAAWQAWQIMSLDKFLQHHAILALMFLQSSERHVFQRGGGEVAPPPFADAVQFSTFAHDKHDSLAIELVVTGWMIAGGTRRRNWPIQQRR